MRIFIDHQIYHPTNLFVFELNGYHSLSGRQNRILSMRFTFVLLNMTNEVLEVVYVTCFLQETWYQEQKIVTI